MSVSVWQVEYRVKQETNGKSDGWMEDKVGVSVLASSMDDAVQKTKRHVLHQKGKFKEDGKTFVWRVTDVRIVSVNCTSDIDIR